VNDPGLRNTRIGSPPHNLPCSRFSIRAKISRCHRLPCGGVLTYSITNDTSRPPASTRHVVWYGVRYGLLLYDSGNCVVGLYGSEIGNKFLESTLG
jgi:hypothetical protein